MFLVFVELSAASEPFLDEGYAGGFVTVVVPADNIRAALDRAEESLRNDGYAVADIDKAYQFDSDQWDDEQNIKSAALLSTDDGQIRYGAFNVWGH